MKKLIALAFVMLLTGCVSTKFAVVGEDEYMLSKSSDACAAGIPSSLLDYLKEESVKFCAVRKEVPVEIESKTEMGIPIIRCTTASFKFTCKKKV